MINEDLVLREGLEVGSHGKRVISEVADHPVGKLRKAEDKPTLDLLDRVGWKASFGRFLAGE